MNNGVRQLTKLTIRYCDWGGSSAKVRQFIAHEMPKLSELEPGVELELKVERNKHPIVIGEYGKFNVHSKSPVFSSFYFLFYSEK
jgi:hypothetical protein